MILEPIPRPILRLREFCKDIGGIYIANSIVAVLFSFTGPVAIIISVGVAGGLSEVEIASWIFAGCVTGGVLTLWYSVAFRQPLSFAWTIPGTVLLGSALDHLSFAEVIGAYWVTGVLIGVIGLSGGVRKALEFTPMPVVLAMVAGIFLQFGLDVVLAFEQDALLAGAMTIAYVVVLLIPGLRDHVPPVIATLIAGLIVVLLTGSFQMEEEGLSWFAWPVLFFPQFSQQSLFELVVPLAITVLVAQNGQGFAVLMNAGHKPPVNSLTAACGIGSLANAVFGSVSACVTGPANAVLVSGGERRRQYIAGIFFGAFSVIFGIFAFAVTWIILKLPTAFVAVLAGLALLPVLQKSFVSAFSGKFQTSSLVTLLITVSDITIWNIGAPFWGLVVGLSIAVSVERDDFKEFRTRMSTGRN